MLGILTVAISCKPDLGNGQAIRVIESPDDLYDLPLGDSLRISIGQCIGCAGSWQVLFNDTLLMVREDGVVTESDCGDCVGGSGHAIFTVWGIGKGNARVGLRMLDDTVVYHFRIR